MFLPFEIMIPGNYDNDIKEMHLDSLSEILDVCDNICFSTTTQLFKDMN